MRHRQPNLDAASRMGGIYSLAPDGQDFEANKRKQTIIEVLHLEDLEIVNLLQVLLSLGLQLLFQCFLCSTRKALEGQSHFTSGCRTRPEPIRFCAELSESTSSFRSTPASANS